MQSEEILENPQFLCRAIFDGFFLSPQSKHFRSFTAAGRFTAEVFPSELGVVLATFVDVFRDLS